MTEHNNSVDQNGACCDVAEGTAQTNAMQCAHYRIDKMDCPTEERLIRNKIEGMTGVNRLDFDLIGRQLTVHHSLPNTQDIEAALASIGMAPVVLNGDEDTVATPPTMNARQIAFLAMSGATALGAEIVGWITQREESWPVFALAAISILTGGLPTLKKGWIALKNFTLNINFLMSLAVLGAFAIRRWPEAAMVTFLFGIAETVEAMSLQRARRAIKSLTALAPDTAEVAIADRWEERPVDGVPQGTRIRVRAGTRVPLDARVETGQATLNQAPITGEGLPVDKKAGDLLYAGSIVADGVVEATVTAVASESTLARIASAVQQAQSQRAPTQRFVDTFSRFYTPSVVALAVVIIVVGGTWMHGGWSRWLYEGLVILVIACPCALVVSTPVTVVSGLAAAARKGILIKGGVYLEGGRHLRALALDKTGTLTTGRPSLTDLLPIRQFPIEEALLIAASLDDQSTHPIARALVNGWRERQPNANLRPVTEFGVLQGVV